MSIFKEVEQPMTRIRNALAKMPWLWATKPRWNDTDRVMVRVLTSDELRWPLPTSSKTQLSYCYAHLVSDYHEQALRLDFDRSNAQWLDALVELQSRSLLNDAQHLASVAEGVPGAFVWRPHKGKTFPDLLARRKG